MNIYRHQFVAECPNNGVMIVYELEIQATWIIHVEHITTFTKLIQRGFHEDIADRLWDKFHGKQILKAHHHGVDIESRRGFE